MSGTSISKSYDPATGVLTLSGGAGAAEYEQVLLTATYRHTGTNPNPTGRTITFLAQDGPFQSNLATTTVSISWVNDAPVLDNSGDMALTAIDENTFDNAGTLVSDLLASAGGDRVTDVDPLAEEGIAVTAADDVSGQWQFSLDGSTWLGLGAVSETAARLVPADGRLRFVPSANFAGLIDPAVTFRAWDQTSGLAGETADVSANGGDTAFSTAVETASITVNNTLGEIHGTVWNDVDEDGTQNGEESGLADWTVILNDDGNGQVDAGEISVVTDGIGDYSLFGLAAGTHTLTLVLPDGWVQTYPAGALPHSVALAEGEIAADRDFGTLLPSATIRGTKWNDLDGDGVPDEGEPGIAGSDDLPRPERERNPGCRRTGDRDTRRRSRHGWRRRNGNVTSWRNWFQGATASARSCRRALRQPIRLRRAPEPENSVSSRAPRDDDGGVAGLDGARAAAVAPDGNHVYVASYYDDAVSVFSRDLATGELSFVDVLRDLEVAGLGAPNDVVVSPDNANVYVVAIDSGALTVYDRDTETGELAQTQLFSNGISGITSMSRASSVAVTADGTGVYVTADEGDSVTIFSREPGTGLLTYVEAIVDGAGVDTLQATRAVVVSPDGNHVYVAATSDSALTVFSRDTGTQALTYVESHVHTTGVVDGLLNANDVTVSPDGAFVYVVGNSDHALAVYTRDAATGMLTPFQVLEDGVNGVDGLYHPVTVETDPTGDYVFAVGQSESAVAAFSRDAATGELTFEYVLKDPGNVDGMRYPTGLAVSPTGNNVYVTSPSDDTVVVLDWNPTAKELTPLQVIVDSEGGVDGLNEPECVALSPDGRHIYVGASGDDAISVFERDSSTGETSFVQVFRPSDSYGRPLHAQLDCRVR